MTTLMLTFVTLRWLLMSVLIALYHKHFTGVKRILTKNTSYSSVNLSAVTPLSKNEFSVLIHHPFGHIYCIYIYCFQSAL